jgi:hypothetical protein
MNALPDLVDFAPRDLFVSAQVVIHLRAKDLNGVLRAFRDAARCICDPPRLFRKPPPRPRSRVWCEQQTDDDTCNATDEDAYDKIFQSLIH